MSTDRNGQNQDLDHVIGGEGDPDNSAIMLESNGEQMVLPDGFSLTSAQFEKLGNDLVLTSPTGERLIVRDYFNAEEQPDLVSADGAVISYDLGLKLAGTTALEVGADQNVAPSSQPIGVVENSKGQVLVTRADGAQAELTVGAPVFEGDIIVTGADAGIGIVYLDNTSFAMGENGRMVLDEMVHDPANQDGSMSISALKGVFTIVSGETAKAEPDAMSINTPAATIGVQGTQIGIQITDQGQTFIVLIEERDGTVGQVTVINDAGLIVLNGARELVSVFSYFSPFSEVEVLTDADIVDQFGDAFSVLPLSGGLANDYGLQALDNFITADGSGFVPTPLIDVLANINQNLVNPIALEPLINPFDPVLSDRDQSQTSNNRRREDDDVTDDSIADDDDPPASGVNPPNLEVNLGNGVAGSDGGEDINNDSSDDNLISDGLVQVGDGFAGSHGGENFVDYSLEITVSSNNPVGAEELSVVVSGLPTEASLSAGSRNAAGDWVLAENELDGLMLRIPEDVGQDNNQVDFTLTVTAISTGADGSTAETEGSPINFIVADLDRPDQDHRDFITGGTDAEEIIQGSFNSPLSENLLGVGGNDIISGYGGIDFINGGDGDDTLNGGDGVDYLSGDSGNDQSFGDDGDDFLLDFKGDDLLDGGAGNDFLTSDFGNDTLTGGTGQDLFVFNKKSEKATITDIESGEVLSFRGSEFREDDLRATQTDLGVRLTFADNAVNVEVTLQGQTLDDLEYTIDDSGNGVRITIDGAIDAPDLSVADVSGNEDTAIDLSNKILAGLVDVDGDESLTVTISGIQEGSTLTAGGEILHASNGTAILGPDNLSALLADLQITPPDDSSREMPLVITATEKSIDPTTGAETTKTTTDALMVEVIGVADAPTLEVSLGQGIASSVDGENAVNYSLEITSELADQDGSETLTFSVSGLPDLASLSSGSKTANGDWTLSEDDLEGLTLRVPEDIGQGNQNEFFTLTVTATSTEDDGDTEDTQGAPIDFMVAQLGTVLEPFFAFNVGEIIQGSFSGDFGRAGGGNDIISGYGGDDSFVAGDGDDILRGGSGADSLSGDEGNDQIFGDEGNDRIIGDDGNDELYGGSGLDTFVFDFDSDQDVIFDIENGETLNFRGAAFDEADLLFRQVEEGVIISFADDAIETEVTLKDKTLDEFGNDGQGYSVTESDKELTITVDIG